MRTVRRRVLAATLAAGLLVPACGEPASDEHVIDDPAHVDEDGRVTLTEEAAGRLGIRTEPVQERDGGLVVPSSSLLVGPEGERWVYTSPEPLVYLRATVLLDIEESGLAFLSDGPAPGTQVVTVGVAELYGVEFGVGH